MGCPTMSPLLLIASLALLAFAVQFNNAAPANKNNQQTDDQLAASRLPAGSGDKRMFGGKATMGNAGNFQSWSDWMRKRAGLFPNPEVSSFNAYFEKPESFQNWHEWAKKRSFGGSGSSNGFSQGTSSGDFQSWKDWVKKRGLGDNYSGLGAVKDNDAMGDFQSWEDYFKKRGFGDNGRGNVFGSSGFQSWGDFVKKRSLGQNGQAASFSANDKPSGSFQTWSDWMKKRAWNTEAEKSFEGPVPIGSSHFQAWNDWAKRGFGQGQGHKFNSGNNEKYQSWNDFSKKSNQDKEE